MQSTVRRLVDAGIVIEVNGVGVIAGDTAKLTLAVLAQLAEMERTKIKDRTAAGRAAARASPAAIGKTHKGKLSLGRRKARDAAAVVEWRSNNARRRLRGSIAWLARPSICSRLQVNSVSGDPATPYAIVHTITMGDGIAPAPNGALTQGLAAAENWNLLAV